MPARASLKRWFVLGLGSWLLATTGIVTAAVWSRPPHRTILLMGWGLILFWVIGFGLFSIRAREFVRSAVGRIPGNWRLKFIVFASLLALVEEGITTTMTNLAPLFGVSKGEAYITASANYLDVVALHSVVVFIPMFVGWAVLLSRYRFSPFSVFVLFGLTGTLAEMSFGWQHAREFGLWIFVYGLMVYLPACCVPDRPQAILPRWYHYPLAVIAPMLFIMLIPLPFVVRLFFPGHPDLHFAPVP